jgi:hypothetical protein
MSIENDSERDCGLNRRHMDLGQSLLNHRIFLVAPTDIPDDEPFPFSTVESTVDSTGHR